MNQTNLIHPLQKFLTWADKIPGNLFLSQPIDRKWHQTTYGEAFVIVEAMAKALSSLQLPPGSRIVIYSNNCDYWILADLAIWMSGHISVPIFPTFSNESINYITDHSEAQVVFVGKLDQWEKREGQIFAKQKCISFPHWPQKGCVDWNQFIAQNQAPLPPYDFDLNRTSSIIYSSGTTGLPKGVEHSFTGMSFFGDCSYKLCGFDNTTKWISYLPLGHVAERSLIEMGCLFAGGSISFVESLNTFAQNVREVSPTLFLAVPRIWSKLMTGVLDKFNPKVLDFMLKTPVLSGLIKKVIKKKMGLDKTEWFFTGAAPMEVPVIEWFQKLDIVIREGYGLTENLGYSHFCINCYKAGTVGKPLIGVEAKVSEEGELLTRSLSNMKGYYKDPEATKEAFTPDGFLKTGDLVEVDSKGFYKIVGRMKEQFKTSKGKFVSPAPLESCIMKSPQVESVCVMGAGLPSPVALVSLNREQTHNLGQSEIGHSMKQLFDDANKKAQHWERLRHLVVVKSPWTIENTLLTPTLKIKRQNVEAKYTPLVESLYGQNGQVVFE